MYISKTTISSIFVGRNFDDNNFYKNIIWQSFSKNKNREFIFFLDKSNSEIKIIVISSTKPENSKILEWIVRDIPEKLFDFNKYEFSIKLSPIKRSYGKFCGMQEDLQAWLDKKADENGFGVICSMVEKNDDEIFIKNDIVSSIPSVTFYGLLEIKDKKKFKESYYKGIGRAKTYGFGLLQLKPVE